MMPRPHVYSSLKMVLHTYGFAAALAEGLVMDRIPWKAAARLHYLDFLH